MEEQYKDAKVCPFHGVYEDHCPECELEYLYRMLFSSEMEPLEGVLDYAKC